MNMVDNTMVRERPSSLDGQSEKGDVPTSEVGDVGMRRRDILAAAGIGSGFLLGVPEIGVVKSDDTIEIVEIKHSDEPICYREVPLKWYEDLRIVRNVFEKLLEKYSRKDGVHRISLSRGDDGVGNHNYLRPVVEVLPQTDMIAARLNIPNQIDGIDIHVEKTEKFESASCDYGNCDVEELDGRYYWDDSDSEYRGGVAIFDNQHEWVGTSGYPVKEKGSGDDFKLLAAAHSFDDEDVFQCYPDKDPAYTRTTTGGCYEIGNIQFSNGNHDIAIIDDSGQVGGISDEIFVDFNDKRTVMGHYTYDAIQCHVSLNSTYWKYGTTTGNKKGTVQDYGVVVDPPEDCISSSEGISVEHEGFYDYWGGEGDSGGPVFRPVGEDVAIIGHIAAGKMKSDGICDGSVQLFNPGYVIPAWIVNNEGYEIGSNVGPIC